MLGHHASHADVVTLLGQRPLAWWEERSGISRKHLSLLRRGQKQISPYEWSRLVLAALYPERALQIARTPLENTQGFEEERIARGWTRGQFAGALGMSYAGYSNASLGFKNYGSQPQKALGWIRAGIDWRDYVLMSASNVIKRQEQTRRKPTRQTEVEHSVRARSTQGVPNPQPKIRTDTILPVVSREIQRHAARCGLLLSAVPGRAGIDEHLFTAILNGVLVPDVATLRKMAKALRVESEELLYSDGEIDAGTAHAASLRNTVGEMLGSEEIDEWCALFATILRLTPSARILVKRAVVDELTR